MYATYCIHKGATSPCKENLNNIKVATGQSGKYVFYLSTFCHMIVIQ